MKLETKWHHIAGSVCQDHLQSRCFHGDLRTEMLWAREDWQENWDCVLSSWKGICQCRFQTVYWCPVVKIPFVYCFWTSVDQSRLPLIVLWASPLLFDLLVTEGVTYIVYQHQEAMQVVIQYSLNLLSLERLNVGVLDVVIIESEVGPVHHVYSTILYRIWKRATAGLLIQTPNSE